MPPIDLVKCMLCGKEAPSLDMCALATPTLGHHVDLAMACKWTCPEPCFTTYKNSPHLRARVYQWQDNAVRWARACVANVSDEALREMESLPGGLRVSLFERERLRSAISKPADQTDDADNHLLHRVCRNINKNPFYHPTEHKLVPYDELKNNLARLGMRSHGIVL